VTRGETLVARLRVDSDERVRSTIQRLERRHGPERTANRLLEPFVAAGLVADGQLTRSGCAAIGEMLATESHELKTAAA
jgi:hypothetical protein